MSYYNTRILELYPKDYGNINRNILAALAIIDVSYPYLTVKFENDTFILNFGGCYSGNMVIVNSNKTIVNKSEITGVWDPFNKGLEIKNLN